MKKIILFLILGILSQSILFSQNQKQIIHRYSNTGEKKQKIIDNNGNVIEESNKDYIIYDHEVISDDQKTSKMISVIIEFNGNPLSFYSKTNPSKKNSILKVQDEIFIKFKKDFKQIIRKNSKGFKKNEAKINYEYRKIYFGVGALVSQNVMQKIEALDYIKKVHISKKVKVNLSESVPLIGADKVWKDIGVQGEGIVVGIFDTGIDYNHPALGGGLGEGYKVIGGFDFVNNDDDPMDDHFHGTHVSGIVAGNDDSIKGVAPLASLMGLKVLDSEGYGYETDIIAAIEWSVDPNNDNNFEDKIDVANFSFGGSGSYDDPQCVAVDNASDLGIIFCIAAGNEGKYGYTTIGSPGTAQTAITVGASDKNNSIAYFSSSGPNLGIFDIKPEIVAPGVAINSCILNGAYETYSGTSMATPHIAGVCALLKEIHPEWEYQEMKSALMSTAKDLGSDFCKQGSGRVDAYKAASVITTITPSHLSFGFKQLAEGIWKKSDTLQITNYSDSIQNYMFTVDSLQSGINITVDSLLSGINITVDKDTFMLSAKESTKIIVSLEVNNEMLKELPSGEPGYYGYTHLINGTDTLNIPWNIVEGTILKVLTTVKFSYAEIFNKNNSFYMNYPCLVYSDDDAEYEIFLLKGKYNFWGHVYENYYYTYHDMEWAGLDTLNLRDEKMIKIHFDHLNENGELITNKVQKNASLIYSYNNLRIIQTQETLTKDLYFNSISNKDTLSYDLLLKDKYDKKVYSFSHLLNEEIHNDTIIKNNPDELYPFNITVDYSGNNSINFIFSIVSGLDYGRFYTNNKQWTGKLFVSPLINSTQQQATRFLIEEKNICTKAFRLHGDSLALYDWKPYKLAVDIFYPTDVLTPGTPFFNNNQTVKFEEGTFFLQNSFLNNFDMPGTITAWTTRLGQLNEDIDCFSQLDTISWILYNSKNTIIKKGFGRIQDTLNADLYFVEFIANLKTDYKTGLHKIKSSFNLKNEDVSPPRLTNFRILNSQKIPENTILKNENVNIRFSVADHRLGWSEENEFGYDGQYSTLPKDSIKLYVKNNINKKWTFVQPEFILEDSIIGFYMNADVSQFSNYDSAFVDVKIVFEDLAGNKSEATWEPCFRVVKIETPIANDDSYEIKANTLWFWSDSLGVLSNDKDPNSSKSELIVEIVEDVANGILELRNFGEFKYHPNPDFIGTDTFTYKVKNELYESNIATVTFEVDSLTNINELTVHKDLLLFPNPVNNIININSEEELNIKIYDARGIKIMETKDKEIDFSKFISGTYILNFYDEENNLIAKKQVIKE